MIYNIKNMEICSLCNTTFNNYRSLSNHKNKCTGIENIYGIIQKEYDSGLSLRDISEKYNISKHTIRINIKTRNNSQASKVARKKYPDSFIWTDEMKQNQRINRLNYLSKKSGKTAWEKKSRKELSYLEEWFNKKCEERNIYEKYDVINEYTIFPYSIDFAFINEKVAVELDGKCHFINGTERIEKDIKKDDFLISLGWKIFRIRYDQIADDSKIDELFSFIGNPKIKKNFNSLLYRSHITGKNKLEKRKINKLEYEKKQEEFIDKIINSDIDFSKLGWVNKVSEILQILPQKVNKWMKRFMWDFYDSKCFKRKPVCKK
jgi:very-short-patch-repair endonuclease